MTNVDDHDLTVLHHPIYEVRITTNGNYPRVLFASEAADARMRTDQIKCTT